MARKTTKQVATIAVGIIRNTGHLIDLERFSINLVHTLSW